MQTNLSKRFRSLDVTQSTPGSAGLQKYSDTSITLSTISFHSTFSECLLSIFFPKSDAVLLVVFSLVVHYRLAIVNKVSDSFWLFSANKTLLWGYTFLFGLVFITKVFCYLCSKSPHGYVSTEIPKISDVHNFPN